MTHRPSFFSFFATKKPRRSTPRRRSSIRLESLEKREVMAANLTAMLTGGVLSIEGTMGNDTIVVRNDGANVSVDGIMIQYQAPGAYGAGTAYSRSLINAVKIDALSGNDTIKMVETGAGLTNPIAMTVNGGWGNDTIVGGSAKDNLNGGTANEYNAAQLDNSLGLYVVPEGEYLNWGGKQEKWLRGAGGEWYFITPDGNLSRQTVAGSATGTVIANFGATYYKDITALTEAGSGTSAVELDKALDFNTPFYQNMLGMNEKWFFGGGVMMNITPDGTVRYSPPSPVPLPGVPFVNGAVVTKLDPSYWLDTNKLFNASSLLTDADQVDGGLGDDGITGGADGDTLIGGAGTDWIYGSSGNDSLWGGAKDNAPLARGVDLLDYIYGGDGADRMWGGEGGDYMHGQAGSDTMAGGNGNDWMYGGDGADRMYGETGNDHLYGEAGYDTLRGDAGDDWLDAGNAGEDVDGGTNTNGWPERDVNPYVTAISPTFSDITQGSSPTCWILAAMGGVSRTEDLSQRIRYLGNNLFEVSLYNRNDNNDITKGFHAEKQTVYFDGTTTINDPAFKENDIWTIILYRGILQAIKKFDPSQSLAAPHSGGGLDPLSILTGKWGYEVPSENVGSVNSLQGMLDVGKGVVVHTRGMTRTLVANHAYTLLGITGNSVILYNPWGAQVTIPWSTFLNDVGAVHYT